MAGKRQVAPPRLVGEDEVDEGDERAHDVAFSVDLIGRADRNDDGPADLIARDRRAHGPVLAGFRGAEAGEVGAAVADDGQIAVVTAFERGDLPSDEIARSSRRGEQRRGSGEKVVSVFVI